MEQSNKHGGVDGLGESRRGSEVKKALSNQSTGTCKPHSAGRLVFSPLRNSVQRPRHFSSHACGGIHFLGGREGTLVRYEQG